MSERKVQTDTQIQASKIGARLFRNNVAKAWVGKTIGPFDTHKTFPLNPGDIIIRSPRRLHAGLCKGSSDLIGWTPVTITSDMVGKTVAVFTAAECKAKTGRASKEQKLFINAVQSSNGIAFISKRVTDLQSAIQEFLCKLKS